jgi:oligosaccharide repeat unit polymerase
MIEGNVPIFSSRIDRARIEFGVFGLHLIVNLQLAIMFLVVEYVAAKGGKKSCKFIMWIIFIITLISFALLLQRFNFFVWAVMTIGLLYYASQLIKLKRVILIIFIFFGFLGGIQSIRLSQYISQYIYVISKMNFPKQYAFFTEPYMYISMNLENMARAVEKLENFTYGVMTFDPLYALFGLKHWIANYFTIDSRPFLTSSYNTFAFHWYYYQDFGIVGILLLPFVTGFIIGLIYYKMRTSAKLKWVVLYSICLALLVISFFTNPLILLNFISNFFILWFIHQFFIRQNSI